MNPKNAKRQLELPVLMGNNIAAYAVWQSLAVINFKAGVLSLPESEKILNAIELGVFTSRLEAICDEIIAANPEQVEQFKAGKEKVLGFFVGQCMKASKGKANPGQLNQLIRDKLK